MSVNRTGCPVCKSKNTARLIWDGWYCKDCGSNGTKGWEGMTVKVENNARKDKEK